MMDGILLTAVIGTGVTVIGVMYTFIRNFKIDMNSKLEKFEVDMQRIHEDQQGAIKRIDHLYHIIIDMLKKEKK